MHLREAELYFEIVDPDTEAVLPPGQEGEVVFTTLRRTGMPLVRYRTGDIAHFLPETNCACGSVLPRISGLRRWDDREDRGQVTLQALDEVVFALEGLTDYAVAARAQAPEETVFSFTLWTVDGEIPEEGEWAAVCEDIRAMLPERRLSFETRMAASEAVPPSLGGKRMIEWDEPQIWDGPQI
jgi:hypothetical protein